MKEKFALFLSLILFTAGPVFAQMPAMDQQLPPLVIHDKGEILLSDGEYSYQSWNSGEGKNLVHVLQYFPATMGAKKRFEPFTDRLVTDLPEGQFTVTTVLNLDRAMWGTSGLVTSEVKASKKEFPDASLVLDAQGTGESTWELGKKGALLLVMDRAGKVIFLTRESLTTLEMDNTIALMLKEIAR